MEIRSSQISKNVDFFSSNLKGNLHLKEQQLLRMIGLIYSKCNQRDTHAALFKALPIRKLQERKINMFILTWKTVNHQIQQ
jgi:hypothetical protein